MFKNLIKKIKEIQAEKAEKRQRILRAKYFEIRGAVIKYYEDKQQLTDGTIELPAFMRADRVLKEVIKSPKDINFYYNMLLKYRVHSRIV